MAAPDSSRTDPVTAALPSVACASRGAEQRKANKASLNMRATVSNQKSKGKTKKQKWSGAGVRIAACFRERGTAPLLLRLGMGVLARNGAVAGAYLSGNLRRASCCWK